MNRWAPVVDYDFWDCPRLFLAITPEAWYCFECPFDQVDDDYSDGYEVFQIDPSAGLPRPGVNDLLSLPRKCLGGIPITLTTLNHRSSKWDGRRLVDLACLKSLTSPPDRASWKSFRWREVAWRVPEDRRDEMLGLLRVQFAAVDVEGGFEDPSGNSWEVALRIRGFRYGLRWERDECLSLVARETGGHALLDTMAHAVSDRLGR